MKRNDMIGLPVKGFKFTYEDHKAGFTRPMEEYVGKPGVINYVSIDGKGCLIKFEDGQIYTYPTKMVMDQLEPAPSIDLNELFNKIKEL